MRTMIVSMGMVAPCGAVGRDVVGLAPDPNLQWAATTGAGAPSSATPKVRAMHRRAHLTVPDRVCGDTQRTAVVCILPPFLPLARGGLLAQRQSMTRRFSR